MIDEIKSVGEKAEKIKELLKYTDEMKKLEDSYKSYPKPEDFIIYEGESKEE